MDHFNRARAMAMVAALAASTIAVLPAAAGPASAHVSKLKSHKSNVVHVHRSSHDDARHSRRRYHRHHSHVVDAPFTRVETGRRVVVDAPFAHVTVNRHGRHIRAPFVNLWLPR
jgi:hypothetical protein